MIIKVSEEIYKIIKESKKLYTHHHVSYTKGKDKKESFYISNKQFNLWNIKDLK